MLHRILKVVSHLQEKPRLTSDFRLGLPTNVVSHPYKILRKPAAKISENVPKNSDSEGSLQFGRVYSARSFSVRLNTLSKLVTSMIGNSSGVFRKKLLFQPDFHLGEGDLYSFSGETLDDCRIDRIPDLIGQVVFLCPDIDNEFQ